MADEPNDAVQSLADADPIVRAAQKKARLEAALERGRTQVRVDPRRAGARLPAHLADEPSIALNLSWRFPHTNMVVNERGVAASLRFQGNSFRCVLPWSAVWAIVPADAEATVWEPDLPPEHGGPDHDDEQEPLPVEPMRPRLSVIGENANGASGPRRKGHDEQNAAIDDKRGKEFADLKKNADGLIYTTEKALEEYGTLLPLKEMAEIRVEVEGLKDALESEDFAKMKAALQRLEGGAYRIADWLKRPLAAAPAVREAVPADVDGKGEGASEPTPQPDRPRPSFLKLVR